MTSEVVMTNPHVDKCVPDDAQDSSLIWIIVIVLISIVVLVVIGLVMAILMKIWVSRLHKKAQPKAMSKALMQGNLENEQVPGSGAAQASWAYNSVKSEDGTYEFFEICKDVPAPPPPSVQVASPGKSSRKSYNYMQVKLA